MPERVLDYLTRPNPTVVVESEGPTTFTYNAAWKPVENIERWDDFNYQTLTTRFRSQLNRQVTEPDVTPQCQAGRFNRLYNESMLEILIGSTITMPVSSVLRLSDTFLVGGGSTWETFDCNPDWGAGKTNGPRNKVGRAKAIVLGDTKYRWSHEQAINIVRSSRNGYNQDIVRPIEQVQYYCATYGCRFGFVITEAGALVMQFFKERELQRSPRPQRNITQPSHRRITSSSTITYTRR